MIIYYENQHREILCFACAVKAIVAGLENVELKITKTENILLCENCRYYIKNDNI